MLKYLVLAAASAAFLLFGMALVYADLGTMEFGRMAPLISSGGASDLLLVSGLTLIVTGLLAGSTMANLDSARLIKNQNSGIKGPDRLNLPNLPHLQGSLKSGDGSLRKGSAQDRGKLVQFPDSEPQQQTRFRKRIIPGIIAGAAT